MPGYRISGSLDNTKTSAVVQCGADGNWERLPTCESGCGFDSNSTSSVMAGADLNLCFTGVDCGRPPAGEFTTSPLSTATFFGDQFTYTCLEDYEAKGSLTTTCQADGKWSVGDKGHDCVGMWTPQTSSPQFILIVFRITPKSTQDALIIPSVCNIGYAVTKK